MGYQGHLLEQKPTLSNGETHPRAVSFNFELMADY